MIRVTEAKHIGAYRLWVRFSDESEGGIGLTDLVTHDKRSAVAALRDPAEFAALKADADTVVWDSGFDLAPEYLHARVKAAAA